MEESWWQMSKSVPELTNENFPHLPQRANGDVGNQNEENRADVDSVCAHESNIDEPTREVCAEGGERGENVYNEDYVENLAEQHAYEHDASASLFWRQCNTRLWGRRGSGRKQRKGRWECTTHSY